MATKNAHENLVESAARGTRATAWGIVARSLLATIKIVGGVLGNSYALIADGIESIKGAVPCDSCDMVGKGRSFF